MNYSISRPSPCSGIVPPLLPNASAMEFDRDSPPLLLRAVDPVVLRSRRELVDDSLANEKRSIFDGKTSENDNGGKEAFGTVSTHSIQSRISSCIEGGARSYILFVVLMLPSVSCCCQYESVSTRMSTLENIRYVRQAIVAAPSREGNTLPIGETVRRTINPLLAGASEGVKCDENE